MGSNPTRCAKNKTICQRQMVLFLGSAPCGRSTPRKSNMLGASELPLRQDLAAQNTCDGAPAPPHLVGVPVRSASILICHDKMPVMLQHHRHFLRVSAWRDALPALCGWAERLVVVPGRSFGSDAASGHHAKPYLILTRSSLSSIGSVKNQRKITVEMACTASIAKPEAQ